MFTFRGLSTFGGKPRGLIDDLSNAQIVPNTKHKFNKSMDRINTPIHNIVGDQQQGSLTIISSPNTPNTINQITSTYKIGSSQKKYKNVKSRFLETDKTVDKLL